jgi:hypothetical protein
LDETVKAEADGVKVYKCPICVEQR